ncbi:stalk domain-containing protein [Paenibacillus ginsengarvi]|nr:stalk domain-containing protein [Paenibacillus ginsengarvi]
MSKKWAVSILAFSALTILSSTIFASSNLKISINGESVKLPNQARVEDGQLLVPIRWITEKLGATLGWSEAESSIHIKTAHQIQLDRFMDVKRDTTARKLVDLWLQGVRTRSGSLQYATLSPKLQQSTYKTFEDQYWGTGGSSPWIENIVIRSEEKVQDNLVRFVVDYDLASSNWHWSGGRKEITVERTQNSPYESWEITSIHTKFNEYEIVTPSETVSDTEANNNEY